MPYTNPQQAVYSGFSGQSGDASIGAGANQIQSWSGLAAQATCTLPDTVATALATGRSFVLINNDATYGVEVVTSGTDVINGSITSLLLWPGDAITVTVTASGNWRVTAESLSVPTNPTLYCNWSTGSDNASGTSAHPFKSVHTALAFFRKRGWKGKPRIWMTGVEALGSNPQLHFPVNGAAGAHEPILIQSTTTTDSGQGSRTVSASSAGSGLTFATITDSTATWTVNQWQGYLCRITSGTQAGKQYWIATNTSTALTLVGTATAPAVGSTFVIEEPGSGVSWTNTLSVYGGGTVLGLHTIMLQGDGSTSSMTLYGGTTFLIQATKVKNLASGGITMRSGARIDTFGTTTTPFSDNPTLQICGGSFITSASSGSIFLQAGSYVSLSRSFFKNTPIDCQVGNGFAQVATGYLTGFSPCRNFNGTLSLVTCIFDTVTPSAAFTGAGQGAAVVVGKGSWGLLVTVQISNTPATTSPGDGVLVMKAHAEFSGVTGTGNAAVGLRLSDQGTIKNLGSNSITGTGGAIQIGSNAATTNWSTGYLGNDLAATNPQMCAVVS